MKGTENKKQMMRITGFTVLFMIFSAACSDADSSRNPTELHGRDQKIKFEVVVPAPKGQELRLPELYLEADGSTLLETMLFMKRESLLEFEYSGAGEKAFVHSIAGIKAGDDSEDRNWIYSLNGRLASQGAGSQILKPGDKIRWCYLAWEERERCAEGQRKALEEQKQLNQEQNK